MKENGDIIEFLKQKKYIMANKNLGRGSFGKTVLIQDPFIDELFVAKKYEPQYPEDKERFYQSFLQEIKIMYKLNHRNVVRIYDYYPYESINTGYILMEFIDGVNIGGYLEHYLPWNEGPTPDNVFMQLIDGFQYIEANNIIHRDIREGNILVDKTGTVKIIDFGLGKIFKPVEVPDDSMVDEINRSGLDRLPREYFDGNYDSQTDMFYLAELINRLLVKSSIDTFFSYKSILDKMMSVRKEDRYKSFSEIQDVLHKRDFSTLKISQDDKNVYQSFTNSIFNHLRCFTAEKKFINNIGEFKERLSDVITKNCFEDNLQNICSLISSVVTCSYRYIPTKEVKLKIVTDFYEWLSRLSESSQQLVVNNIIAKLSIIEEDDQDDELPF